MNMKIMRYIINILFLFMIIDESLKKRTPIHNLRKATLIKDEVDNYKVYRFE